MRHHLNHLLIAVTWGLWLAACDGGAEKDEPAETDSETEETEDTDSETEETEDTIETEDTDAACWVDSPAGRCFDCPLPTAPGADSLKFLNQCNDSAYAPFDNATRVPATTWVPGTPLPSL